MGIVEPKLKFAVATFIVIFAVTSTKSENIVLNSYRVVENQLPQNIMYKVNLDDNMVIDSLILNYRGAFFSGYPINIYFQNFPFLFNFIQNGLTAKNAFPPKGRMDTYYFIVNRNSFDVIVSDSLPYRGIAGIEKVADNRISFRWIDEANRDRVTQEDLIGIGNDNRLRVFSSNDYIWPDYTLNDLGEFKNPKPLLNTVDTTIYWDTQSSTSDIYLFKHNPSAGILTQTLLGDRREMNIVVGYSETANVIYSFTTPYKMYSYSPAAYSADTLNMIVRTYDPSTLNQIDSLLLPIGDAYAAMEIGSAKSLGPYLYYYYFWQDGYQRFDPAYLLIFDTRTNEASWLRVGWR